MKTNAVRIMTYNVHRCVGRDGVLSPGRVAAAIAEQEPDLVALQELDVGRRRTAYADQAAEIATKLGMALLFHPAYQALDEQYGDALLSRWPMALMRRGELPTLSEVPQLERRGALWAAVQWGDRVVHFLTTHLGLLARERLVQAEALLGKEWLGHETCSGPVVLAGDLNAVPGTRAYRKLRGALRDPFPWTSWPMGTFPSGCPLLRIDHVFLSREWVVRGVKVPRTRLTRLASDHLPLVVEASLP